MYKIIDGILLLCLFVIINNGAKAADSKFLFPKQAKDEDVQSLRRITSKEALPLVLFAREKETEVIQSLFGLTSVEIKDGRLASGTKFYTRTSAPQIFFCPKSDPSVADVCLAPKQFGESQPLECDFEPIPNLTFFNGKICGVTGTGKLLTFAYRPFIYTTNGISIYTICYDKPSGKVLHVGYALVGAALLKEKLVAREREIEYDVKKKTYGHIDANYYDSLLKEAKKKPQYDLQKLVPTDDMALATSIKATHYFANFALQHKALIKLWNEITSHMRNHAIEWKDRVYGRVTAIYDLPSNKIYTPLDNGQKTNIWITTIVDKTEDPPKIGLAILMNNFIAKDSKNQDKQYIDDICGIDLCAENLKNEFRKVNAQGRCCALTPEIYSLVYPNVKFSKSLEILHVENITYSV